jgi:nicotinamidase-related amidase
MAGDLHGNAPDDSPVALLIIDMINAFDFEGAKHMLPRALAAGRRIARLKERARKASVPAVYVNDNFGRWRSDFRQILEHVLRSPGKDIAELLEPKADDYFVLKPKHSGFQFTTLDVLLQHLGARTLVLTGVAGNFCVLFTAHDAYMRDYRIVVPGDCIASLTEESDKYALEHMADVTKADVRASGELDFTALAACRRDSRA